MCAHLHVTVRHEKMIVKGTKAVGEEEIPSGGVASIRSFQKNRH